MQRAGVQSDSQYPPLSSIDTSNNDDDASQSEKNAANGSADALKLPVETKCHMCPYCGSKLPSAVGGNGLEVRDNREISGERDSTTVEPGNSAEPGNSPAPSMVRCLSEIYSLPSIPVNL